MRRRVKLRRGATAIELALILPLLLTIILACIDFGRVGYLQLSLTNAVRAGAAIGSSRNVTTRTLPTWRSAIRTALIAEITGTPGFSNDQLTIPDPELVVESAGVRRVRVRAEYRFTTLVPWPFLPTELRFVKRCEMRLVR